MKKEKYKGVPKFKSGDICIWIDTSTTINRLVTILNYVITKRNGIIYTVRDNATQEVYEDIIEQELTTI